jgi:hypothetical protein
MESYLRPKDIIGEVIYMKKMARPWRWIEQRYY